MSTYFRFAAAVLCGSFLISACGQEGPLYLPGTPSEIKTTVPQQGEAPEQDEEESQEQKDL
jgi:predicted small lipoprotein YifL